MSRTLALFDFDGTITNSDTLFRFTASAVSPIRYWVGLAVLSPVLVLHKLGVIGSQKTKELFLSWYFSGLPLEKFNEQAARFAERIPWLVRPKALIQIKEHLSAGDRVIVVSASAENWIRPWTEKMGIELLATRLQVSNGHVTGKVMGLNCNGPEKVSRIRQHLRLEEYSSIVVYGDSSGDREMLGLGTLTHFMPFRD